MTDDMGTPSLLDALATPDARFHSMLPNMGLACGLPWVDAPRGTVRYVLGTRSPVGAVVDCPDCLARYGGVEGLRAEIVRAQTRQAAA